MKLLKCYFELQKQIHDYFGYREDWVVIPLEDGTNYYWMVSTENNGNGWVAYSEEPFIEGSIREGKKTHSAIIYTQRHLPKWVYRADDYTMISIDTNCDDNKFLMVFDNKKECTDESLKDLYAEHWGR